MFVSVYLLLRRCAGGAGLRLVQLADMRVTRLGCLVHCLIDVWLAHGMGSRRGNDGHFRSF